MIVESESGRDSVGIPSDFRRVDGVGGDLDLADRDAQRVVMSLEPNQRAYLFTQPLISGVGGSGAASRRLDRPDSSGAVTTHVVQEPNRWRSVRVYDSGACSVTMPWPLLSSLLTAGANTIIGQEVGGGGDLNSLTLTDGLIKPRFQFRTTDTTSGAPPLGPGESDDRFGFEYDARAEVAGTCPRMGREDLNLFFNDIRVSLEDASVFTDEALNLTNKLLTLSCSNRLDGFTRYDCRLPSEDLTDPLADFAALTMDELIVRETAFGAFVGFLDQTGCGLDVGDRRLECFVPNVMVDPFWEVPVPGQDDPLRSTFATSTVINLDTRWVPGARDFRVQIGSTDASVNECFTNLSPRFGPEGQTEQVVADSLDDARSQLRAVLLDELTRFDLTPFAAAEGVTLPPCDFGGLDPIDTARLSPNDVATLQEVRRVQACETVRVAGIRRAECSGDFGGQCTDARLEPRRINLRPEGIELVFAEDESDEQYNLAKDAAIFRGQITGLCDPGRYPLQTPTREFATSSIAAAEDSEFLPVDARELNFVHSFYRFGLHEAPMGRLGPYLNGREVCGKLSTSCTEICPEAGITCAAEEILDNPDPLSMPTSVCMAHQCVIP